MKKRPVFRRRNGQGWTKSATAKRGRTKAPVSASTKVAAIVLAAGEGKRMQSDLPKVCIPVAGQPMVRYPVHVCLEQGIDPIVVVISGVKARGNAVREVLRDTSVRFGVQAKPRGTADAVRAGLAEIPSFHGPVLILYGDVPLLEAAPIQDLLGQVRTSKSSVAFVSMVLEDSTGYGRVVRSPGGGFERIVEEKDATEEQRRIREVNTGVYVIDADFLRSSLGRIERRNAQREFYLTDLPAMAARNGDKVLLYRVRHAEPFLGVNSPADWLRVEPLARQQRVRGWMEKGVQFQDPNSVHLDPGIHLERGAVIGAGVHLLGATHVAKGARIESYAVLRDTQVKEGAVVKPFSVLDQSVVGANSNVGPFAHLRPGSHLGRDCKVGNFVEMKKTRMSDGAKASHLSYLGDAAIGPDANIGAGTITCNYDGYQKFETVIGAGAFIGSDTQLVAPVRVGKGAVVAAGTTVTRDVPADALALSRTAQENKPGWAKRRRALAKKSKTAKRKK